MIATSKKPEKESPATKPKTDRNDSAVTKMVPVSSAMPVFGNRAMQRYLSSGRISPKLEIGSKNDTLEREADQTAESVVAGKPVGLNSESVNNQNISNPGSTLSSMPNNIAPVNVNGDLLGLGSGQTLDATTRNYFEPRFQQDFRHVRIHTDEHASQSATQIKAKAYTYGQNVVFNRDQYEPHSARGKKLLAHELTHVVQHSGGKSPKIQRQLDEEGESNNDLLTDPLSFMRFTQDVPTGPLLNPPPNPVEFLPVNLSLDSASPWRVVSPVHAAPSDIAFELYGIDVSALMQTEKAGFSFNSFSFSDQDQFVIIQGLLRDRYRAEFHRRMNNLLNSDLKRVKSLLLETYVDSDEEETLMYYVRRWESNKNWVTNDGRSYFDEFLGNLKNSTLHTDYGLWNGNRRSFLDELYDNIEDDVGELNTLLAQGSIEYGGYRPIWYQAQQAQQGLDPVGDVNKSLVNRSADMILDRLEGITTSAASKTVREVISGLPGREQAAVLQQIMARHDESVFEIPIPFTDLVTGVGRFGEPTENHMLYYLFENLDDDDKKSVADSLRATGVLPSEAIDHFVAGRSLAGQYVPVTTYYGSQAAQFYADEYVQSDNPLWAIPGGLASLWIPETATQTAITLGTAGMASGLGPALVRGPVWLQKIVFGAGTLSASYQGTVAINELITGEDAYTGEKLSDTEMVTRAILAVSNTIFLATGLYGAAKLSAASSNTGLRINEVAPLEPASGPQAVRPPGSAARPEVKILSSDSAGNIEFVARHPNGDIAIGRINLATGNGRATVSGGGATDVINISAGKIIPQRPMLPPAEGVASNLQTSTGIVPLEPAPLNPGVTSGRGMLLPEYSGLPRIITGGVSTTPGTLQPTPVNPLGLRTNCGFCSISWGLSRINPQLPALTADQLYIDTLVDLGLPTTSGQDPLSRMLLFPPLRGQNFGGLRPKPGYEPLFSGDGNRLDQYTLSTVARQRGLPLDSANDTIAQWRQVHGEGLTVEQAAEARFEFLEEAALSSSSRGGRIRVPEYDAIEAWVVSTRQQVAGDYIIGSRQGKHFMNMSIDAQGRIVAYDVQDGRVYNGIQAIMSRMNGDIDFVTRIVVP